MKFYIATRLERAADHNLVRDQLVEMGHEITYDWTAHGSVQKEGAARIREVALAETRGVQEADFVVVLLPGGRGTHAELGLALAFGIPVLIHSREEDGFFADDGRTCAFYHHPLVTRFEGPIATILHHGMRDWKAPPRQREAALEACAAALAGDTRCPDCGGCGGYACCGEVQMCGPCSGTGKSPAARAALKGLEEARRG